ncbi:MAG: DUF421 domain-containing protein [Sporolactobacillus sp.]
MDSFGSIAVELTVGLFALLLLTKIMGRASLSEATPFDFIAMIVVGDFVSEAIYDPQTSVLKISFAIFCWGLLIYLIDIVTLKFHKMRAFIESDPVPVIHEGRIDRAIMRKNRIDMNHLQMLLRDREVFSIREVAYALLEPNGTVSIIRKPEYALQGNNYMKQRQHASVSLPYTLISDGKLLEKNLTIAGKSKRWLKEEMQARSIRNVSEVLIAEWRKEDGLFIQTLEK